MPTSDGLSLRGDALLRFIEADETYDPVLVVATVGTTSHGAVDDIAGLTAAARRFRAHMHVDAAWAGSALLVPEMRSLFLGIADVDSVTVDPHKWLSVPMGAGLYLARDWTPQEAAFSVDANYMPSASLTHRDAYIHSIQWSRRFIGLKLFMAMAILGEVGYGEIMRRQIALGDMLRHALIECGWQVVNDTPLPLVCFAPATAPHDGDIFVDRILETLLAAGDTWLSTVACRGRRALRACITSYETTEQDVERLLVRLNAARAHVVSTLS